MTVAVLVGSAALVALFLIVVASRPAELRVRRTGSFTVPPAAVFEHVNDLRKWEAWSPWAKKDPNAKSTFEGPSSGTGARMCWAGNKDVGEGSMTITESRPHESIRMKLEFLKPFACTNAVEFLFRQEGGSTQVTWTMTGRNNFISKAMGMFMDVDKMVGGDFEKGLASLKRVVEHA